MKKKLFALRQREGSFSDTQSTSLDSFSPDREISLRTLIELLQLSSLDDWTNLSMDIAQAVITDFAQRAKELVDDKHKSILKKYSYVL